MADLDQLFTTERLNADSAELQRRMTGRVFTDDPIHLEAELPGQKPKPPEKIGNTPTPEQEALQPGADLSEVIGDVGKTAVGALGDERNAWMGTGLVAGATVRWMKAGKELATKFHGVQEAVTLKSGEMTQRLEQYSILEDIPGKVKGTTVDQNTLTKLGYERIEEPAKKGLLADERGSAPVPGGGLNRPRFQVEDIVERALNPSPLAERVTDVVNTKTGVLTDTQAAEQAQNIVKSGGVTHETLTNYAPGTALVSAPQALAAQTVLTTESRNFIDTARVALDTNDPAMAEQALAQFARLLDPAGSYSGAVTSTAQTLRVASSEDVKALNLLLERSSTTTAGMSPLEQLAHMLKDPATDPAKQGKSLTQSFRNVISQVQEVVATGDTAGAQVLLHEIQATVAEDLQLDMFVTPKDVVQAQKVIKSVTAQHIVEANKAAIEKADKGEFKLTPTGPNQPKAPQTDYLKEEAKNKLATVKEHQAQDLRVSEGTSVFSPKREKFKLTPPPGGAKGRRSMTQLDLLNLIAKEPEPEQLALEMAASVEHPELSKQFLSMIRKAQDAVTFGKTDEVGKVLAKIQKSLIPPVKAEASQPTRLAAQEKKALVKFFQGIQGKDLNEKQILQALAADPSLQPDALIKIINNLKNPTWRDAAQHLIINSMLSPTSDFINFAATATMLPVHLAARSVGARVGSTSKLLGGKAGVIVGEDEAMIHGLYSSFWDSIKLAGRVAKSSKPEIGPQALREQLLSDSPITADAMFSYSPGARKAAGISAAPEYNSASYPTLSRAGLVSSAINFIGVATGLPGRFMLTGDQFIQSLAMNAEMHALVYRKASEQAVREGYTAAEFYKSYRPIWRSVQANLPPELRKAGEEFSLEVSLNKELGKLGATALNIREQVNKVTGIGGTVALPFFKTLANSAKATWEFSPLSPTSNALGIVAKGLRNDMFGSDPVKRDLAIGKWAVGTMFTSSMVMATLNGRLRGRGPDNKELRQQGWDAKGLPDSFIYNTDTGDSFQINRLGVLANLAGMAADVGEVWLQADEHTRGEMAQLLVTAYVGNLTFDFLQNSAGVIQALANGVKGKEDLDMLARSLPGFIPLSGSIRSAEKALTSSDDPLLMKDARTSLDKILARFPGYDTLARKYGMDPVPVLRNQFGYATIQPKAAYGTEWFNPMYVSGPSQNDTLQKVSQIEINLGMGIAQPSNIIGKGNVPLSAPEYDEYQRLAGEQWETRATALLPTLQRTDIPDQVKRDLITQHLGIARQTAAMQLKGDNPKLIEDLTSRKVDQYTNTHAPKKATRSADSLSITP